jgi:hypothetical protein
MYIGNIPREPDATGRICYKGRVARRAFEVIVVPEKTARINWTPTNTLTALCILAGVLGVAWNLLSIAGVSMSYATFRERQQDRAAVAEAERAHRDGTAATAPATVIVVHEVPPPPTVLAGVTLCVVIFIFNTALAFLLIASAGMLPQRPRKAWPLLQLYVRAKLPGAVLAGVAWGWLLRVAFDRTTLAHVAWALVVVALGIAAPMMIIASMRRLTA